jgi:aryl-phospho-beta-D-glucosidase BglC (GH1 family)
MTRSFALLCAGMVAAAASAQTNAVPVKLLNKLTNGVNVTRWFCYQGPTVDPKHFDTYWKEADFAALKRLKVNFVRLCLSPDYVYQNGQPNPAVLPAVDRALARLEKAGLAVIFDLHDNGQLKLDAPGQNNEGLVSFWQAIAKRYRGKQTTNLVFEIVNEPVFQRNPEVWYALHRRTVDAIRKVDPKRTIMATATSWSGIDAFASMKPLTATNIIYTYHCYDPFLFTHQGATWAGDQVKSIKQLPFPSSPEAVAKIIDGIPENYQKDVRWYGEQKYDEAYLKSRIALAENWGKRNRVPVLLGEFGAYPPESPVDSRGCWFAAMRRVLDGSKVRRAIWGYDDGLGLGRVIGKTGLVEVDSVTTRWFYGLPKF